jgi:membrane associated rhomboid family serine protease
MSTQTVTIMLAWLGLCMVGIIPHVANAAHLVGLIAGMVLAHGPYSWHKLKRAAQVRERG